MAVSNSTKYRFVFIALLIVQALVISGIRHPAPAEEKTSDSKCDLHQTACTRALPECTVTLDIKPKPVKAMTDLTFEVILSGKKPAKNPYIDLGMPGMDMGPNRVTLESCENNHYKGNGIIVRCPSGRKTWKVSVTVPNAGTAEYIFDVIY